MLLFDYKYIGEPMISPPDFRERFNVLLIRCYQLCSIKITFQQIWFLERLLKVNFGKMANVEKKHKFSRAPLCVWSV